MDSCFDFRNNDQWNFHINPLAQVTEREPRTKEAFVVYKILLFALFMSSCASQQHQLVREPSSEEKFREQKLELKTIRMDTINRAQ